MSVRENHYWPELWSSVWNANRCIKAAVANQFRHKNLFFTENKISVEKNFAKKVFFQVAP